MSNGPKNTLGGSGKLSHLISQSRIVEKQIGLKLVVSAYLVEAYGGAVEILLRREESLRLAKHVPQNRKTGVSSTYVI